MSFSERLPKYIFIGSLVAVGTGVSFGYGVVAYKYKLPPIPFMQTAMSMIEEVFKPSDNLLRASEREDGPQVEVRLPDVLQPGLLLVAGIQNGRDTSVKIIDRAGTIIHEWQIVWSEVWPDDAGNFPSGRRPETGMYLHGLDVLPDGDLVANFEHLSTFRADICGDILWKLDNLGHHAVHVGDDDTIWVTAETFIDSGPTGLPFHEAPIRSWTIQNLDQDGNLLREFSVFDVIVKNDLMGLLFMSTLRNGSPYSITGDTLHLNDVDVFPRDLQSEVFSPGDVMLSLRNINAVLVVDPDSLKVKFLTIGGFMRQHDPDFMAGDRISIFDNRNFTMASDFGPAASRIVEVDARTGVQTVALDGTAEAPFFTNIMGTHQRLDNGNILINESGTGRVLEYTPAGELAFRYDNRLPEGGNGRTFIAEVLPLNMDAAFFAAQKETCIQ